jgi:hypothetical protein
VYEQHRHLPFLEDLLDLANAPDVQSVSNIDHIANINFKNSGRLKPGVVLFNSGWVFLFLRDQPDYPFKAW